MPRVVLLHNTVGSSSKFWEVTAYADGTYSTRYGKIGSKGRRTARKRVPAKGIRPLIAAKRKKGYVYAPGPTTRPPSVATGGVTPPVIQTTATQQKRCARGTVRSTKSQRCIKIGGAAYTQQFPHGHLKSPNRVDLTRRVDCTRTINGNKLRFVLEQVCSGTQTVRKSPGLQGGVNWRQFINERLSRLKLTPEEKKAASRIEEDLRIRELWMDNKESWYPMLNECGLRKSDLNIPTVVMDKHIGDILACVLDHAPGTLRDFGYDTDNLSSLRHYISLRKRQSEAARLYGRDLINSVRYNGRCLHSCKSPFVDTWVVYVIYEKDVAAFDLASSTFEDADAAVLLLMTVSTDSTQYPRYQYHMGIHRSLTYIRSKRSNSRARPKGAGLGRLSLKLHGFASRAFDSIWGEAPRLILSDPLESMVDVMKSSRQLTKNDYMIEGGLHQRLRKQQHSLLRALPVERRQEAQASTWLFLNQCGLWPSANVRLFIGDNGCVVHHSARQFVSTRTAFSKLFKTCTLVKT